MFSLSLLRTIFNCEPTLKVPGEGEKPKNKENNKMDHWFFDIFLNNSNIITVINIIRLVHGWCSMRKIGTPQNYMVMVAVPTYQMITHTSQM